MKRRRLDCEPHLLHLSPSDVSAAFRAVHKWYPVQPLDEVKKDGVDTSMSCAFPLLDPDIHSLAMTPRTDDTCGLPVAIHYNKDTSGSLAFAVTLDDPLCVPTAAIEDDFVQPAAGLPMDVRPALVHRRDSPGVSQHHVLVLPLSDVYRLRSPIDAKELWKTLVRDWHFELELVVRFGTGVFVGHTPCVVVADADDVNLDEMD